jgi:cyclopropane fatty-acyl-phospholipid synthase-like methyltransferase
VTPPGDASSRPQSLVEAGYDTLGPRYLEWANNVAPRERAAWVDELLSRLRDNSAVLELGCGPGIPVGEQLAAHHHLTGVDLSREQLRLARKVLPDAELKHADMTTVHFDPSSFDAVVALYCINHVPQSELKHLVERIGSWLRPDGLLLANFPTTDNPGIVEANWLGVDMYFSGMTAPRNLDLLLRAGFSVLQSEVITQEEFGSPVSFLWVLARR